MCKERVEKGMAYTKGVISSALNVEKAELTVIYKSHKITPEKIREAISKGIQCRQYKSKYKGL